MPIAFEPWKSKENLFHSSNETLGVTLRKQDSCWSQFTFDSSVNGESVRSRFISNFLACKTEIDKQLESKIFFFFFN